MERKVNTSLTHFKVHKASRLNSELQSLPNSTTLEACQFWAWTKVCALIGILFEIWSPKRLNVKMNWHILIYFDYICGWVWPSACRCECDAIGAVDVANHFRVAREHFAEFTVRTRVVATKSATFPKPKATGTKSKDRTPALHSIATCCSSSLCRAPFCTQLGYLQAEVPKRHLGSARRWRWQGVGAHFDTGSGSWDEDIHFREEKGSGSDTGPRVSQIDREAREKSKSVGVPADDSDFYSSFRWSNRYECRILMDFDGTIRI